MSRLDFLALSQDDIINSDLVFRSFRLHISPTFVKRYGVSAIRTESFDMVMFKDHVVIDSRDDFKVLNYIIV